MSANSKLVFALSLGLLLTASTGWSQQRPLQPGEVNKAFGDSFRADGSDAELAIREIVPLTDNAECTPARTEQQDCSMAWFDPRPLANKRALSPRVIAERDRLYSLAALAVVNADWQFAASELTPEKIAAHPERAALAKLPRRGHNIGGILVDERGELVWWERNSNGVECNGTNHGETRMMISYLNFTRKSTLPCHTIYTSLEPCAMCSGMMTQQNIARTVYVQKDHGFGAALERLHQPYAPREFKCGFPRAPRSKQSSELTGAPLAASSKLDRAYHDFIRTTGSDVLVNFLQTEPARSIYQDAEDELTNMNPATLAPENQPTLLKIRALIGDLKAVYARTNMSIAQHVQIERARRTANLQGIPRAGFPAEPLDACCRPRALDGTNLVFPQALPLACNPTAQPRPFTPVAVTPPRNPR
ncbi:MAG TPA: deaminase [Bdellovibrionota bacterium]|nr:deaminase [Bdellovibrionota bacterium]